MHRSQTISDISTGGHQHAGSSKHQEWQPPASPQQRLFGWRPQRKLCKHLRRQIWPACQAGQGTEHCEVGDYPWSSIIIHPWKSEAPQGTSIYHRSFPGLQIHGMGILPETSKEFPLEFEGSIGSETSQKCGKHTPSIGEAGLENHLPKITKMPKSRGAWTPKPAEAPREIFRDSRPGEDCAYRWKITKQEHGCHPYFERDIPYQRTNLVAAKLGFVFHRWDMLVPRRAIIYIYIFFISHHFLPIL